MNVRPYIVSPCSLHEFICCLGVIESLPQTVTSLVLCAMVLVLASVVTVHLVTSAMTVGYVQVRLPDYCQLVIPSLDVDECESDDLCSTGTYCENSVGSYTCKGQSNYMIN